MNTMKLKIKYGSWSENVKWMKSFMSEWVATCFTRTKTFFDVWFSVSLSPLSLSLALFLLFSLWIAFSFSRCRFFYLLLFYLSVFILVFCTIYAVFFEPNTFSMYACTQTHCWQFRNEFVVLAIGQSQIKIYQFFIFFFKIWMHNLNPDVIMDIYKSTLRVNRAQQYCKLWRCIFLWGDSGFRFVLEDFTQKFHFTLAVH